MAFPSDLEIEVAFNNDIDETDHAQTGWTSILPFVASFSGDLRGRDYELERAEAGSLSVVLDNSDGRFLPGSVQSPYYPYVKSDRRFRIRGKNMVHPNVARGGGRDRAFTGFLDPLPGVDTTPSTQEIKGFDEPIAFLASAEPNAGQGKEKVYDGQKNTMWTVNTTTGWIQYQYAAQIRIQRYSLTVPAGNTTRNPKNWTLQGSNNGSSWTTIHTVTNNTWSEDYEYQEFTVTSPGYYQFYRLDISANQTNTSNIQLAELGMYMNDASDLPINDGNLTHYVKIQTPAGMATNQWHEVIGWYVPLEYGVRLAHSAHIWRIANTGVTSPSGMKIKLHIVYLDDDLVTVGSTEGISDPNYEDATVPSGTAPTQVGFSHTPPATAKYGMVTFAIWIGSSTNATVLNYGITGIQSELPTNLAPDISGYRDHFNWQIEADEEDSGTVASIATTGGTGAITEATSPAYVSGNATTITTASFTPANNSLLVAMVSAGNGTGAAMSLGAVTDSLGGTWTRKHYDYDVFNGVAEVWMRDVGTGAAMTVTWNPGGTVASGLSMQVQVLTGAKNVAGQTGAVACIGGGTSFTKVITTTAPNSRIYGSFGRAQTAVTLVGNSNTTIYGQIQGVSGDAAAAIKSGVIATPQSITMGFNNTDTAGQHLALVEVLAANQTAADPTTAYVEVGWTLDVKNVYITIPHLIPGEWYTATVEAKILPTQTSVFFTGDEGETGVMISSTSWTQYTVDFLAQQPEQELRWIVQTPDTGAGLHLRKLRVEHGADLTLSLPTTATESGVTGWLRPKDIFEGWIERWPVIAGQPEMSITVVDRMKRMSDIDLANTLKEALMQDIPQLLMPLSDSMIDTPGRFSQLGSWGDEINGPTYVDITAARGGIGGASYTTATDDGPTGEASFKNNPTSIDVTGQGYFFTIPYSPDYTYVPQLPGIKPPQPKPTPPRGHGQTTSTYTKKWYATWSRSYEGDNSTRFDDSAYMYQGQFSGSPGNQKSLAGFDYNNIVSTLTGAEILEVYITVRNNHARWNKGLYVFVGSHNYTSKPSTWNGSNVRERRWKKWVTEGGSVTINAGTTFGTELRTGASRGIGIGPESDSDNYGFFYGATHSSRPYITIKYRK